MVFFNIDHGEIAQRQFAVCNKRTVQHWLSKQNACQEKNSGRKSKKHMACFSPENEACAAEATTNRREEIKSMHEGDYLESGNERRESKGETNWLALNNTF